MVKTTTLSVERLDKSVNWRRLGHEMPDNCFFFFLYIIAYNLMHYDSVGSNLGFFKWVGYYVCVIKIESILNSWF